MYQYTGTRYLVSLISSIVALKPSFFGGGRIDYSIGGEPFVNKVILIDIVEKLFLMSVNIALYILRFDMVPVGGFDLKYCD